MQRKSNEQMKEQSKAWFNDRFMDWRSTQTARRAGITQFSAHIGIGRDLLNNYMLRGSCPEGENLAKVGKVLGEEIYEIWNLPKPDPRAVEMMDIYAHTPKKESLVEWLKLFGGSSDELKQAANLPPSLVAIVRQLLSMSEEDVEEYAAILRAKTDRKKRVVKDAKVTTHH